MANPSTMIFIESGRGEFGMRPIENAKALGLHTLLVARNVDLYQTTESSLARFTRYVDAVLQVDTRDPEQVLSNVLRWAKGKDVSGVFTSIDYFISTAARIAAALGIPGLSPAAAARARDKLATMEASRAAGVPSPKYAYAETKKQLHEAAERIGWPLILKPLTEAASIGVKLCRSEQEADTHLDELLSRPTDTRGQPRPRGALIEEYLNGYEVSVESFDEASGERTNFGVTDKGTVGAPYFIEDWEAFPSGLPSGITDECLRVANAALDAIAFDFGPSHVELRVTADGPKLVEVNGRMASDPTGQMVRSALGVDIQMQAIRLFAGMDTDLRSTTSRAACARSLVPAHLGTFLKVDGIDLVQQLPGFVEFVQYMPAGTDIGAIVDDTPIIGHFVFEAETHGEALMLTRAAESHLHVTLTH